MTNPSNNNILVGYNFDSWYSYAEKDPVTIDTSLKNNTHTLICGMSGSGKSYFLNQYMARLALHGGNESKFFFADFKGEDSFLFLKNCPRYYSYDKTTEALDIVYNILHKRQSGEDTTRYPVTLFWDEYFVNVLTISGIEKKRAETVMRKVSEILMTGRSMGIRLVIACQRPDAVAFPSGSRLNFGVIIIVGASLESIYSMLMPKEMIEKIGDRVFSTGEGVMLWQGSELSYVKVPVIRNEEQMKAICVDALTH